MDSLWFPSDDFDEGPCSQNEPRGSTTWGQRLLLMDGFPPRAADARGSSRDYHDKLLDEVQCAIRRPLPGLTCGPEIANLHGSRDGSLLSESWIMAAA